MKYEVIVGNVGYVYSGYSERMAWENYHHYVEQSKTNPGNRCHGESVVLMEGNEIRKEYLGTREADSAE